MSQGAGRKSKGLETLRKGQVMEILRETPRNGEATWVSERGKLFPPQ